MEVAHIPVRHKVCIDKLPAATLASYIYNKGCRSGLITCHLHPSVLAYKQHHHRLPHNEARITGTHILRKMLLNMIPKKV